jgi:hypothetical protein
MHGRFTARVRGRHPSYWLVAPPIPVAAPHVDHVGLHGPVEWAVWIAVIVVVGLIAWRVINRRLPPG